MKIRIIAHINTGKFAHYPGQILIDAPYEAEVMAAGAGQIIEEPKPTAPIQAAVPAQTQNAAISPAPYRPANIRKR